MCRTNAVQMRLSYGAAWAVAGGIWMCLHVRDRHSTRFVLRSVAPLRARCQTQRFRCAREKLPWKIVPTWADNETTRYARARQRCEDERRFPGNPSQQAFPALTREENDHSHRATGSGWSTPMPVATPRLTDALRHDATTNFERLDAVCDVQALFGSLCDCHIQCDTQQAVCGGCIEEASELAGGSCTKSQRVIWASRLVDIFLPAEMHLVFWFLLFFHCDSGQKNSDATCFFVDLVTHIWAVFEYCIHKGKRDPHP